MQRLDLTLPTAQANLDLDADLFEQAERADAPPEPAEALRFWECPEYCVVLGRSSRTQQDVRLEACDRAGVRVLRRTSGGGTVLLGPGCLSFSLLLSLTRRPALRLVRDSFEIILGTVARGLSLSDVRCAGVSDLVFGGLKFSGSAQRRGRSAVLHHGTILYGFDLARVTDLLHEPARQPAYRAYRTHAQFLCNVPLDAHRIKEGIAQAWNARP